MISIVNLDAEDLRGMAVAIAISNCTSMVTRDPGAVEDGAAGMLPDSISIMVRPDR
jgi:hypothetical protein